MGPIILNYDPSLFTNIQCNTPEPFSNMQPQAGLAPDINGLFDLVQPQHRPSNNFEGAGSMADSLINPIAVSFSSVLTGSGEKTGFLYKGALLVSFTFSHFCILFLTALCVEIEAFIVFQATPTTLTNATDEGLPSFQHGNHHAYQK